MNIMVSTSDPMPPARPQPDRAGAAPVPDRLATLRRRIAELERRPAVIDQGSEQDRPVDSWLFGLKTLDDALPATGLAPDGLHEASGGTAADGPAAAAFLAALLVRLRWRDGRGTVLVCQSRWAGGRFGRLHGPGWRDLGLDAADFLVLRTRREEDVPWAMEEGLRCAGLAAVLAEVESIDFIASRRLSLASREGLTPALLLRHDGLGPASAALTRWRVAALPGRGDPFDGDAPGPPRWRLELVRCRGGRPAACDVEWNRETGDFSLAAALADRPAAPGADTGAVPRLAPERKAG